jgi:hypothetical protein
LERLLSNIDKKEDLINLSNFRGDMMKNILLAFAFLSTNVIANVSVGEFSFEKQSYIVGYETEAECAEIGGQLSEGTCLFQTEDTVTVSEKEGVFTVDVSTIGGNAHSCSFTEVATKMNNSTLVSAVQVDAFNYETGTWGKDICVLAVTYKDADTVSVTTNGKCRDFHCGMRAGLEIEKATRK